MRKILYSDSWQRFREMKMAFSWRSVARWLIGIWWRACSFLRYLRDLMQCIWRSLHTWWIVTKIRFNANPVWAGVILVGVLLTGGFLFVATNYDIALDRWGSLLKEVAIDRFAKPWQNAVRCHLYAGGTQSPIGDYLALEVVVLFLGRMVEKVLHFTSDSTQEFSQRRPFSLVRGVLVALILLVNLAVTGLISYGFLWPLPPETPLRILYGGLAIFMLTAGFGSSVYSVIKTFPVRSELIWMAIVERRNKAMTLSSEACERRKILKSRNRMDNVQPSVAHLSCFLEWNLINRPPSLRDRLCSARKNFLLRTHEDPRFGLGRQIMLTWAVRFGAFVLMIVVSLISRFIGQPIMSARMWSLLVSGLILLGATNSVAVCLGAFKGRFRSGVAATVGAILFDVMILGALIDIMHSEMAGSGARDAANVMIVGTLSLLLVILEYFCVLLAFEMRDPTLVSLVRKKTFSCSPDSSSSWLL